jgi:hypothetical protein
MLDTLAANGCDWRAAGFGDLLDRPLAIVAMTRGPLGDTPIAFIRVGRTPLERRYAEIKKIFPEAMMPIE